MKNLILCAFAALLLFACNKYDDTGAAKLLQVPPYTEKGANTFGCLLNGTVWANFGATIGKTELGTHTIDSSKVTSEIEWPYTPGADTTFLVGAEYSLVKKGKELRLESMSIQIPKNGSLKGTHLLTGTNGVFRYTKSLYDEYTSTSRRPFTVIINKDSLIYPFTHIVSGRFSGVLYNRAQTDSVNIAGGVFDTRTIP